MLPSRSIYRGNGQAVRFPYENAVNLIFLERMSPERDRDCLSYETDLERGRGLLPGAILSFMKGLASPRQPRFFRPLAWSGIIGAIVISFACGPRSASDMSAPEKKAIADSLKRLVVSAYDLSKPDPVKRLMSLYPTDGRVISASGGVTTTTRPQLQEAIEAFWTYVGQNMRQPRWEWTSMTVDVLASDAAVMTSTYRIPHLTPMGMNHVIGGAWTAVFQKRGGKWVIIQEHLSDVQSNPNIQTNP